LRRVGSGKIKNVSQKKKKIELVSPEAMKVLSGYHWPGNVRELENVMERAVILTNRNVRMPEDVRESIQKGQSGRSKPEANIGDRTLEELEEYYILKALEKYSWNQKQVSEVLGISTTTLWRKLKSYGIEPKRKD